ncbi:hypothetical protein SAY87_025639 [Trapa incisa]|uniref:Uncharacterized protein n=1 Tax=Trapa incisa TaxID=236973 RepID=A0AAN7JJQ2_9MYRT|nr:hypothetical protein SAY87_025639 [Trapa incisa]
MGQSTSQATTTSTPRVDSAPLVPVGDPLETNNAGGILLLELVMAKRHILGQEFFEWARVTWPSCANLESMSPWKAPSSSRYEPSLSPSHYLWSFFKSPHSI